MLTFDNSWVIDENHYEAKAGEESVLGSDAQVDFKLMCLFALEQMIE